MQPAKRHLLLLHTLTIIMLNDKLFYIIAINCYREKYCKFVVCRFNSIFFSASKTETTIISWVSVYANRRIANISCKISSMTNQSASYALFLIIRQHA